MIGFLANLLAGPPQRHPTRAVGSTCERDETTPAAFREWVEKHKPEGG